MPFNVQDYVTIGAGGLCVLSVLYMLFTLINKIIPALDELKSESQRTKEFTENMVKINKDFNENAIKEVKAIVDSYNTVIQKIDDSNNNIAKSLEILAQSNEMLIKLFDKHDTRTTNIEIEVTKIAERVKTK